MREKLEGRTGKCGKVRESVLTWERLEIGTGIMKYCTYALFAKLELSENNGRNVKGRTRLEEGDESIVVRGDKGDDNSGEGKEG